MARPALFIVRFFVFVRAWREPQTNGGTGVVVAAKSVEMLLMRHGQSQGNVFPRQGPFGLTDPALTADGRAQASTAGTHMSALPKPDIVMSSCLLRAMETALNAFPNDTVVHVAPYISELNWGHSFLHPASQPTSRPQQRTSLLRDLGESAVDRMSYAWSPPTQKECGPPDWSRFLTWLWAQDNVSRLIADYISAGGLKATPRIAIVSHGNFLQDMFAGAQGFPSGHPHNAQVVAATLSIQFNTSGDPVGFSETTFESVVFEGFDGTSTWRSWAITICLIVVLIVCCVFFGIKLKKRGSTCSSRQIELRQD
eukprot:TRINITY_DN68404_c0_g1_i1.p1 TRINITY_DN68404_c0_g1~~TRINITY_DN68404_c0_g1_i1.p1  ORF type:complete len:311 (+),score=41.34 TRINITY_DN68404_c0_g1_i1:62-994(+)